MHGTEWEVPSESAESGEMTIHPESDRTPSSQLVPSKTVGD